MPLEDKPKWIRVKIPSGPTYSRIRRVLRSKALHTVCEEALCPNVADCWGCGTVTIMLLGDVCTRSCRFCAVKVGKPMGLVDEDEPERVAAAVSELGLDYVVLTSVCRDDLQDGGARVFAEAVRAIRRAVPKARVEVLIPDFKGDRDAIEAVVRSRPDVIGHNLETVKRLTPIVRDRRAGYNLSLNVLKTVKELDGSILTKSSLMLGLGEVEHEVLEAMADLRSVDVDILTLGQYLSPTKRHLPVAEYIPPETFDRLRDLALSLGFKGVASAPLVRSSYKAAELFQRVLKGDTYGG
ncbi:MAG: lipoyl synthase [Candidatus Terraquivivens tikiterensis]|uniref:Lipoyl synthase n=1 Tax=Candidatus Terraquivivens tikiterensis TaxID=1980982 RepID=A0A2R7YA74_9ARCH|nr:MAG: lipoyl synthase [Candidatus Terraquivivens tikiterensis]